MQETRFDGSLSNGAASFMQDQMNRYLNSYQQLLQTGIEGATKLQLGQDAWKQQMEYATKLLEASQMIFKATAEYFEKCVSQGATGWQQASQTVTDGIQKQQDATGKPS